ncbi:MAG: DNA double-strand break repair nuclease NurA [Promethearchaeota archaeon]
MKSIKELWALDEAIQRIADQIQIIEEKRNSFASILREERLHLNLHENIPIAKKYLFDDRLAHVIKPIDLTGLRVGGVDGGLLKKTLRGIELVITRACATIFEFTPSNRVSVIYFPEKSTLPTVKAELNPISWREADVNASLERLRAELELAIRVQDHHPVELLLLDGSLRPHISDRPSNQSVFSAKYERIAALFDELYEKTRETGTLLAGVVKDSRSQRFIKILGEILPHLIKQHDGLKSLLRMDYRSILRTSYDTDLFFRILEVGERSPIIRLNELNLDDSSLVDAEHAPNNRNLVCIYLRTAQFDYPLRIEIFTGSFDPARIVEKVSAMLFPMSSNNEGFALPTVLIDADSQARLIEHDLDFLFTQLANRIGYPQSILKLRRERMPFH